MLSIIPKPDFITETEGCFRVSGSVSVIAASETADRPALLLSRYLVQAGFTLVNEDGTAGSKTPSIILKAEGEPDFDEHGFCNESYTLKVTSKGVQLTAENRVGLSRGIQTFRQLLPAELLNGSCGLSPFAKDAAAAAPHDFGMQPVCIPCCTITDTPRFPWRGVHLDTARHFLPIADVARFIDLIALHKYNRLHFHLTEDQGWRIEIKQFPRLTEVGAWRSETLLGHYRQTPRTFDGKRHGGFYTQAELKTLTAYAAEREVEIVPEIDMPGHMQAAIAAYPEWGCTGDRLPVREMWGISPFILNVEPSTVKAMKQILGEVMDIFPGKYIHVGGDEAPKALWEISKQVQKRMAEYGARNEDELQSWFIRQMDEFITAQGRRTIGWDEILEGGLAPNAAVMSWRGEDGGIAAAMQNHHVVMTPTQYTYFDYYQDLPENEEPLAIGGFLPVSKVYSYEPVPQTLPADKHHLVLGSQAQHWSEYIPDRNTLLYMAFPRLCALSEVLWMQKDKKNYTDFLSRLKQHRRRLETLGVNAHPRP